MADRDSKRYYWLKLEKDFFKRHDIRIIEGMPNGKDYIIFYLKLLCESTSHEGYLRFSETIPYNETMLSTITNTNIDIVRSAIKVFTELQMMTIYDDGTIYFKQVEKMIGSETGQTIRKREARETKRYELGNSAVNLTLDIEKEKEIDIELDIEKEKNLIKKENDSIDKLQDLIQAIEEIFSRCLTNAEAITIKEFSKTMSNESIIRDLTLYSDKQNPIAYMKKMIENAKIQEQVKPYNNEGTPQQPQTSGSAWLDNWKKAMKGDKEAEEYLKKH